jgi:predicted acyltransferase
MSTIPAIATGLLGIITGNFLKNNPIPQTKKVIYMLAAGIVFLLIARLWNLDFPINKNLWTSSFVFQVGGLSLIFLGVFYYIIDVKGYKNWAFFFKIIGMNSILIYMSEKFIDWDYTNDGLFKWLFQWIGDPFNIVATAVFYVLVKWFFLYFLYRKKVFLRV